MSAYPPILGHLGDTAKRYGDLRLKVLCTSHIERANWTLRGHLRRFTRLSNGFSQQKAKLRATLALFFAYYNFCRMHKSIRMTPAIAAGITRKPWTMRDLLHEVRQEQCST